jgi:hypothetical protein
MSTKYKATMPGKAYFVTLTTVCWIDLFTRLSLRNIIVNSLNYCSRNKRTGDLCLLPDAKPSAHNVPGSGGGSIIRCHERFQDVYIEDDPEEYFK